MRPQRRCKRHASPECPNLLLHKELCSIPVRLIIALERGTTLPALRVAQARVEDPSDAGQNAAWPVTSWPSTSVWMS